MYFDSARFQFLPGGRFTMGDDGDGFTQTSRPRHDVSLRGFAIAVFPVTQNDWLRIMGHNPSNHQSADCPVEMVSWFEALEYCNRLSLADQLTPCYQVSGGEVCCNFLNNGYRLPTEAEWEYAARAGIERIFSGSDQIDEVAWYKNNSGGSTHGVGKKNPNDFGLYDMSGNVWEWCWDWFGQYQPGQCENPAGPAEGSERVARGGSWLDFVYGCTVAVRSRRKPSLRQNDVGFRLVRSVL